MKTLLILSWRNIWRHPARSGALLAAVITGLWAGVLTIGTMNGIHKLRMDYLINNELTHVQAHQSEFLAQGDPWNDIPEPEKMMAWLANDPRIAAYASRTLVEGMLQSPVKTSGVRIRGIDVAKEPRVTHFIKNMVEGRYLAGDVQNPVIMGESLAKTHHMMIGNRIVLIFENTRRELTSAAFHIVGIFKSPSKTYDNQNVFVRSRDLAELLADQSIYHEIAMILHDQEEADAVAADLNARFPGIKSETWFTLSPVLRTLLDIGALGSFLITLVIMLALAFGILNTMLMALFERMHEIGMLLSIGMDRSRVFIMILMESVILTLTGALAGMILARLSIWYLAGTGINLKMFARGAQEIGWDKVIPMVRSSEYGLIVGIVMAVTIAASIYPAVKATHVNPIEAVKERG